MDYRYEQKNTTIDRLCVNYPLVLFLLQFSQELYLKEGRQCVGKAFKAAFTSSSKGVGIWINRIPLKLLVQYADTDGRTYLRYVLRKILSPLDSLQRSDYARSGFKLFM